MVASFITIFGFSLMVAGVLSCITTPTEDLPAGLPRVLWLLIIILIGIFGPLAWFIIRWVSRQEKNNPDGQIELPRNPLEVFRGQKPDSDPATDPAARFGGSIPPDENPEFLFSLEAQLRRQRLAQEARQKAANSDQQAVNSAEREDASEVKDPNKSDSTAGDDEGTASETPSPTEK